MNEKELESFLDTGWYNEATLFYEGYVYWCEGYSKDSIKYFFVDKWKAECNNNLYSSYVGKDNNFIDETRVLELTNDSLEKVKREFLNAPIFNGKSFWDVYKILEWVNEGKPINI